MPRKGHEIWLALAAILFITLVYLLMMLIEGGVPKASSFFGEGLGILGFVLMVSTEILYTLRKRSSSSRWGRVADWFQLHIFTGLVGPYLVLLHTSWKFYGLPGGLAWLMILVTISGIGGRYIYTAVPRSADGIVLETGEIESQIARIEAQLETWLALHPQAPAALSRQIAFQAQRAGRGSGASLGQSIQVGRERLAWQFASRRLGARERAAVHQLEQLIQQRNNLRRQVASLALMRRLLGYWTIFHVPIGLGMFVLAFIHIVTAIFFTTGIH